MRRRRASRNPERNPIHYPVGMRPVRAPFIIGAEYEFDNFIDGVYVLRLLTINASNKWAKFGLDRVGDSARGVGVRDEEEFYGMKPRLVGFDRKQLAYDLQDVFVPLEDPDDELREVVSRVADAFARVSGTKRVAIGRTNATVIAARRKLRADVRAFADANRIDAYEGRPLPL